MLQPGSGGYGPMYGRYAVNGTMHGRLTYKQVSGRHVVFHKNGKWLVTDQVMANEPENLKFQRAPYAIYQRYYHW